VSEGERLFLIVEPDASTHRALESALTERGDRVLIRDSADQALEVLCSEPVDLVIASTTLADGDGFRLCSLLRDQSDFDAIRLLFISDDSSKSRRLEGLQSGAGDYVTKPFFLGELDKRIDALLDQEHWVASDETWEVSEGTLSERSLVEILAEVEDRALTGTLSVERDGRQAVVHCEGGAITGAVSGTLEGKEALLGLVAWPSGDYVLRSVDRESDDEYSPDEVVLVSIEPLEPWNEIIDGLPEMRRRYERNESEPPTVVGFDDREVEAIWELFDGARNVGEVLSASESDLIVALRIVDQLVTGGHLEDVTDRDEVPGPGTGEPKPDFARWIDPAGWSAAAVDASGESNGFRVVPPPREDSEEADVEVEPEESEDDRAEDTEEGDESGAAASADVSGAEQGAVGDDGSGLSEEVTTPEPLPAEALEEAIEQEEDGAEEAESQGDEDFEVEVDTGDETASDDEGSDEPEEAAETSDREETSEPSEREADQPEPARDAEALEAEWPDDAVAVADGDAADEAAPAPKGKAIEFDALPDTLNKPFEEVGEGEIPGEVKEYDPDESGMQPFARHRPGTIEHVCLTLDDEAPGASGVSVEETHEEPPSERIEPTVTPDAEVTPEDGQFGGGEEDVAGFSGGDEDEQEDETADRVTPVVGVDSASEEDTDREDRDDEEPESDAAAGPPEPDESRPPAREDSSESAGTGPLVLAVIVIGGAIAGMMVVGGEEEGGEDPADPDPKSSAQVSPDDDEDESTRPDSDPPDERKAGPAPGPDEEPTDSPDLQVVRDTRRSGEDIADWVAARASVTTQRVPAEESSSEQTPDSASEEGGSPADGAEAATGAVAAETSGAPGDSDEPAESTETAESTAEPGDGSTADQGGGAETGAGDPGREEEAVAAAGEAETGGGSESGGASGEGGETFAAISGMIDRGDFAAAEQKLETLPSRLQKDAKVRDLYLNLAAGYQTEAGDIAAAERVYGQYLELFPDGKYADQVRSILARLDDE